ncbi:hypothetical protein [Streptomyces chumphonensis]|uniref:hypothetical protein n=1 Tax=Streptomyces chumphonensis TaxID=1214925 RepID=UPI003D72FADF
MTDQTSTYGDPTEWDEIPDGWTAAFTAALAAHGHTVTEAHESAITVDVPGLPEGHAWYLGCPNHHGMWGYGVANERGVADHVTWLAADAADPQAIADLVHAVLTDARLGHGFVAGSSAAWLPAST